MNKIREKLERFLKDADKTVFLSIGSELRADDAAAILTANELLKKNLPSNFKILLGYTAPENLTGEIKKFAPTHIIICDAANSGLNTGEISIISADDIDGAAFSTHMMPMNVFINYISRDNPCKTLILGIQPETLEFGVEMSAPVKKTAVKLADLIFNIIKK
ncbi:MAG: hydrogenase 3 maturation endopeptidase HyCI [Endomicrobia bacterium]|nr:hydrogenase 3 maturation endopeptidase HyCI [Endomicrobiia bacterium]MCL2507020.1 hydrogenase 3 maturation endopeptidase HyCI [Endomicrobiia bacterium]